ncbi:MAG TPA: phytanoyl-CoA dioxygenase family protein [Candidatus Binataceae bacterium]|nr:phytanoyl-CoA dioxygenase family protein [Candidatus Binataceae bacterium]
MASIPVLAADHPSAEVVAALERDGCVVVTGVLGAEPPEAIARELGPHLEKADIKTSLNEKYAADGGPSDFYPGNTRRITALAAKSEAFRALVTHPLMLAACDSILKPNCASYQVHATSALVVGPGATVQMLHREEDSFQFFKVPRPNLVLASMWAISEFTAANGGTHLVPGSHRWSGDRVARADEVVSAAMPAGSVLLWMGGTLHGAGANVSDGWRFGVFLSYSLGWLRQEENQYVDTPLELARTMPKQLRDLLGYKMHSALGFMDAQPRQGRPE